MAELDKFKRRIIRTVARMTREEKRPEEEMWVFLKNETKCDCKLLWERMRSLTLKKIKRLLIAGDKLENIIPVARMSLTDWLLFDLVLVHEDIDVIGEDLDVKPDSGPLFDLLNHVKLLQIEGKQGDALAQAWTAATIAYNKDGKQCSPMLLQKRWYQMKKSTRMRFYKLWYTYRGNLKKLEECIEIIPTELQKKVAQRYPHVITKPFLEWEKLIEQKFVILPEEIEKNIKAKIPENPNMNDSGDADLVILEPNIETIDLEDVESETEVTMKDETNNSSSSKLTDEIVVVKTEPLEDTVSVDKEALAKERDAKLLESIPDIDAVNYNMEIDNLVDLPEENDIQTVEEENSGVNTMEKTQMEIENMVEATEQQDASEMNDIMLVKVKSEIGLHNDDECLETDTDLISEQINEIMVMPQITNVYGNVGATADVNSMSMNVNTIERSITETESSLENCPSEPIDIHYENNEINDKLNVFLDNKKESEEKKSIVSEYAKSILKDTEKLQNVSLNTSDPNPYMDIPIDLTFADDGIELVEDGIVFEDEEDIIRPIHEGDIKPENSVDGIQKEVDSEDTNDHKEEIAKFDLKLLMQPVVYTTRLDEMVVFENINIDHVNDVKIINEALVESKPIIREKNEEDHNDMSEDKSRNSNGLESDIEMSEPDDLPTDSRVKLSSCLLQKPRSRSYNPIQLCKNPDFNTRLKRLTVGFLSSTRNRSFLKTLKPVTIDVSKAFESKMINGTMYLINSLQSEKDKPESEITEETTEQTTSVLPSAMPVQSLIDNFVESVSFQPAERVKSGANNSLRRSYGNDTFPERNRVINLPDLDEVRKMNRQLFTAEITPMRIQSPNEKCIPPVQLVSSRSQDFLEKNVMNTSFQNSSEEKSDSHSNIILEQSQKAYKPMPKSFKQTRFLYQPPVLTKPGPKSKMKYKNPHSYYAQCRSKPVHTVDWLSKRRQNSDVLQYDDALLTIDTLNKMLNIITNKSWLETDENQISSKKKNRQLIQQQIQLTNRLEEFEYNLKKQNMTSQESVQCEKTSEKTITNNEATPTDACDVQPIAGDKPNIKTAVAISCCWARFKIKFPKSKRRHNCPHICKCCCRHELIDKKWGKGAAQVSENVVTAIESVVQKSRELSAPSIHPNESKVPIPPLVAIDPKTNFKAQKPQQSEISIQCDLDHPLLTELLTKNEKKNTPSANISNIPPKIIEIDDAEESAAREEPAIIDITCNETMNESMRKPRISVLPTSALISPNNVSRIRPKIINRTKKNSTADIPLQGYMNIKRPVQPQLNESNDSSSNNNRQLKEKWIYLNAKQKYKPETGCPIYLGRNKILLTDGNIPSDLNSSFTSKTIQAQQMIMPLTVPAGVQIVVQPDGQMSYTIDPAANLSPEKLANMPTILSVLQGELRSMNSLPSNSQVPQINTEVVNLIDDENSNDAQIATKSNNVTNNSNNSLTDGALLVDCSNNLNNVVCSVNNIVENNQTISDNCATLPAQESGSVNHETLTGNPNKSLSSENVSVNNEIDKVNIVVNHNTLNKEDKLSSEEQENDKKLLDKTMTNDDPVEKDEQITDDLLQTAETSINSNVIPTSIDSGTSHEINNEANEKQYIDAAIEIDKSGTNVQDTGIEKAATDRSSLLSDLMEMSGISAEDAKPNENVEVQMPHLLPSIPESSPSYLQTAVNATPVITTSPSKNVKELNSITSFAQLKYACENNGNFFKLDLETGLITSITVSIKKNLDLVTKSINKKTSLKLDPKSIIDLTEEQNDNQDREKDLPTFIISKPTKSLLKDSFHLRNSAKPLRVFKSANIISRQKKSKAVAALTNIAVHSSRGPGRPRKKRKQSFDSDYLHTDDSFDSIEEYLWSDLDQTEPEGDSSDDEPLAVIAKRMRTDEESKEASTVVNNENNIENNSAKTDNSTQEIAEKSREVSAESSDKNLIENNAVTNDENKDDSELYTEITFLSEHEDYNSEDDCILGV